MSLREINRKIYSKFYLGQTGVATGSIAYGFEVNGAASGVGASLTEDSYGWYEQSFIPDTQGIWTEKIAYGDFKFTFNWEVAGAAVSSISANEKVWGRIYVGTTGLVQANFRNSLELNNTATAVLPTITEEGGGWYDLSFTPDADGDWILWVQYGDENFILEAFVAPGAGASSNTGVSVSLSDNSRNVVRASNAYNAAQSNNARTVSITPAINVSLSNNSKGVTVR